MPALRTCLRASPRPVAAATCALASATERRTSSSFAFSFALVPDGFSSSFLATPAVGQQDKQILSKQETLQAGKV